MKRRELAIAIVIIVAVLASANKVRAQSIIVSAFDSDIDGWSVEGQVANGSPSHAASDGNPPGALEAIDACPAGPCDQFDFVAPEKFLLDKSSFYGGSLSYHLWHQTSGGQDVFGDLLPDVKITGNGLTLTLNIPGLLPPLVWNEVSIDLDESADWQLGVNDATQSEILSVLSDLSAIRIRGDYQNGVDTVWLDNVELLAAPQSAPALSAPAAFVLFALLAGVGTFALATSAMRHKRPHA